MMRVLAALALCAAHVVHADSAVPSGELRGTHTTLGCAPGAPPHHDGSAGDTRLVLRGSGAPREITVAGVWHCLGFAPGRGAYVLIGEFETGAWLPIKEIKFLDESGAARDSRYNATDWFAFAAVPGPELRYIAFVGKLSDGPFRLEVLDVGSDTLIELGPAPRPPPLPRDAWDTGEAPWGWGASGRDGYLQLDAGVVIFDGPSVLRARYGKDSFQRRAAKRTTSTWDLAAHFAKRPRTP